jgi:hypothetical protein
MRRADHVPFPKPPPGQKWICAKDQRAGPEVALLVDQVVIEVSQILLQIEESFREPSDLEPQCFSATERWGPIA